MKFDNNPYYSPELCGLKILESIDTNQDYAFDMFVVWKKIKDGTLWWDTDSGCSCPVPFDNGDNSHDLKKITNKTFYNFDLALKNHYNISKEDYHRIRNKVKYHLSKLKAN